MPCLTSTQAALICTELHVLMLKEYTVVVVVMDISMVTVMM